MMRFGDFIRVYTKRSILLQFLLGIPSGLPLALTASTLTVWLSEAGVSKASIGIFAAVALPYSLKFLWAPLLDGLNVPLLSRMLGRRRSWMLATQLALVAATVIMALGKPEISPFYVGLSALFLAFCSASHDIAKDAYRVEILPVEEQGAGVASFVLGYRIGAIVSTAGALYLATYTNWQSTYLIMALILLVLTLPIFFTAEPVSPRVAAELPKTLGSWLGHFVVEPFADFIKRPQAIIILAFILLYRMSDAFLGIMANPFYIELGFSKTQIAEVVKLYGLFATILGSILGGSIVYRFGVYKALWVGGLLASLSNLMFVWQEHVGAEPYALALTITTDNLSGGVATAAIVAYMSGLCNREFTATQYALLSSLVAVGRSWLSTPAGVAAEQFGWDGFFILSTFIGIPALLLLFHPIFRAIKYIPPATASEPQAVVT